MPPPGVCRNFYRKGNCKFGDQCKFPHIRKPDSPPNHPPNSNQSSNKPPRSNQPNSRRRRRKNTECFDRDYTPYDLRVLSTPNLKQCDLTITNRDVLLIHGLFEPNIYQNLLQEMKEFEQYQQKTHPNSNPWKSWHGDSHLIVDDKLKWQAHVPTFEKVIDRIREYFKMDIKATRFNHYQDHHEWKPYHHDAAAVKPEKAKTQNFTVGVSFGATRDIAFQHAKTKTTVGFPLTDGTLYAFSRDVNIEWRHGVPATKTEADRSRISIIAWGQIQMEEMEST